MNSGIHSSLMPDIANNKPYPLSLHRQAACALSTISYFLLPEHPNLILVLFIEHELNFKRLQRTFIHRLSHKPRDGVVRLSGKDLHILRLILQPAGSRLVLVSSLSQVTTQLAVVLVADVTVAYVP